MSSAVGSRSEFGDNKINHMNRRIDNFIKQPRSSKACLKPVQHSGGRVQYTSGVLVILLPEIMAPTVNVSNNPADAWTYKRKSLSPLPKRHSYFHYLVRIIIRRMTVMGCSLFTLVIRRLSYWLVVAADGSKAVPEWVTRLTGRLIAVSSEW